MIGGYIRVVAPATLEEDFTFDVLLDGKPFMVVVPKGGVQEGEEFEVPYPMDNDAEAQLSDTKGDHGEKTELGLPPTMTGSSDDDERSTDNYNRSGVPYGKFRTSLCSCCDVVMQATFWMALCCFPVLLAQVLTRLRLKWDGTVIPVGRSEDEHNKREHEEEMSMTFVKIILTFVGVLLLAHLPVIGSLVLFLFYFSMMVWIGGNLRRIVRHRYKIPTACSMFEKNAVEDRCVMCFCGCCAIVQLARHTHNDKEYPGYCMTMTGLELGAPQIEPYYCSETNQISNKKE